MATRVGGVEMDRRRFLIGGTSLATAVAMGGIAERADAFARGYSPLSVGFLAGSGGRGPKAPLPWQLPWIDPGGASKAEGGFGQVVPAAELPLGDQSLAGGLVRIRVAGLYPGLPAPGPGGFRSVTLAVLFPSPDPAFSLEPVPYFAFGARRRPGPTAGSPVSFPFELDAADGGIEIALEVVDVPPPGVAFSKDALVPRVYHTRFTVDWEPGRPKLQRGVYLLGIEHETWAHGIRLPRPDSPAAEALTSVVIRFDPVPAR